MSEQPRPTDQAPSGAGPDRPAQGWTPAPLSGGERASFASRNPADSAPPEAGRSGHAIDRYAPRRSVIPVIATVVAVVAAAAIFYTTSRPQPAPSASPTPSQAASPASKRPGKQFTADRSRATGIWQITDSRWTQEGLDVYIEVTLDSGSLTPSFDAMPNSGNGYVVAEESSLMPAFRMQPIQPPSTIRGWIFFRTTRETTLIFLGDANNPQISGIEVPD